MTQKPIKATLDNTSDECKTQKPILIQLEDIPQPTDADAGKVLGVDEEGKYALTEGGGGGGRLQVIQGVEIILPDLVETSNERISLDYGSGPEEILCYFADFSNIELDTTQPIFFNGAPGMILALAAMGATQIGVGDSSADYYVDTAFVTPYILVGEFSTDGSSCMIISSEIAAHILSGK